MSSYLSEYSCCQILLPRFFYLQSEARLYEQIQPFLNSTCCVALPSKKMNKGWYFMVPLSVTFWTKKKAVQKLSANWSSKIVRRPHIKGAMGDPSAMEYCFKTEAKNKHDDPDLNSLLEFFQSAGTSFPFQSMLIVSIENNVFASIHRFQNLLEDWKDLTYRFKEKKEPVHESMLINVRTKKLRYSIVWRYLNRRMIKQSSRYCAYLSSCSRSITRSWWSGAMNSRHRRSHSSRWFVLFLVYFQLI